MHPSTKKDLQRYAADLMSDHPPMLGEGYLKLGSQSWLHVRLAYQRWLAQKLTAVFPEVTSLEAVETIAPMLD